MIRLLALALLAPAACVKAKPTPRPAAAPLSRQADTEMLSVSEGRFLKGSTLAERESAYEDYLDTRGRDTARANGWFKHEPEAVSLALPAYRIDRHPVTHGAFAEFVTATGALGPFVDAGRWRRQGFVQDYETEVVRFNWNESIPPASRLDHPVVLVPWAQATAYCRWRGKLIGQVRRLPSADEFEKAARGANDSAYPWGARFDASRLNSAVSGPRDTVAITSFPQGVSAFGVWGMAGNVFQWTSTPWPHSAGRMTVKGSAWDDWGGLGRAAAAHGRPATVAHAIVGFRCAGPPAPAPR